MKRCKSADPPPLSPEYRGEGKKKQPVAQIAQGSVDTTRGSLLQDSERDSGYAVFQPNFRGSEGYGQKFIDADRFDFGGGDMRDILTGIDHLVREKLVDKDRQFVYGTSYGGFMTCWLVGHTSQFRAAVAQNAVTELNVFWGLSDLQSWVEWEFGGRPWEVPGAMRKHSPLTHAANVRTPTLILIRTKGLADLGEDYERRMKAAIPLAKLGEVEDPDFGLMHVRIQTWFPFTIQVQVNGHSWLARQMLEKHLGFVQHDNAFTQLDNPGKAQQLADRFPHLPWVKLLDRWAALVNPLLGQSWLGRRDYYWVIDQAEYSTAVLFRDRAALADLYPRLLDHALRNFSAADILTFLGRRLHPRFDGEVLTDCKKDRQPGARIKHRVKNNWLKMYDKFALILRIETVINQPREFKVRRRRIRQGRRRMLWCPMNKGVANFYHYHAVARAANQRYLDALAAVPPVSDSTEHFDRVSKPAPFHGRRRQALNLLAGSEQCLFQAVLQGEHRLHGFRNADIARELFGGPARTRAEQRRRTAHVSRLLQLLRAHGLIAKVAHSYRYRITSKGEMVMSAALSMRHRALEKRLKRLDEAA